MSQGQSHVFAKMREGAERENGLQKRPITVSKRPITVSKESAERENGLQHRRQNRETRKKTSHLPSRERQLEEQAQLPARSPHLEISLSLGLCLSVCLGCVASWPRVCRVPRAHWWQNRVRAAWDPSPFPGWARIWGLLRLGFRFWGLGLWV